MSEKILKKNAILVWHWLPLSRLTAHTDLPIIPGKTLHVAGPVELCSHGYHASVRALDALQYSPNSAIVQRCTLWGEIERGDNKIVATNRTCLWIADATRTLHEFAIWCAEQAIETLRKRGVEPHPDSLRALMVKRMWLDGNATDHELDAAESAAESAAWSAAESAARSAAESAARSAAESAARSAAESAAWSAARSAAESAARSAAWSAAESAARSAAWSAAWSAAESAAWSAEAEQLETMLLALAPTATEDAAQTDGCD